MTLGRTNQNSNGLNHASQQQGLFLNKVLRHECKAPCAHAKTIHMQTWCNVRHEHLSLQSIQFNDYIDQHSSSPW